MSNSDYDDEQKLIQGLLQQDENAYRYLVKRYQAMMRHLAVSICGEIIADEVVQESWVSVMGALPKFESRSSLKTWVLRIVANEAKSRLRKEKRYVSIESLIEPDPVMASRFSSNGHWSTPPSQWHEDSPDALLTKAELQACIKRVLTALPSLQAATLRLKELEGMSLTEICNILDVSESNVRVLLHRARNRLFMVIDYFQSSGKCQINKALNKKSVEL